MTIEISKAVPEDAEGITTVLYKTWLATYPNEEAGITVEDIEESYKDAFSPEKIQQQQEKIAHSPESVHRFVAKDGEKVVGVTTLNITEHANHLKTLYILPEYQKQGIGKMLWEQILPILDSSKDTILEVTVYNTNAIEFYKKLGFIDTGKVSVYEGFRMKSGSPMKNTEMILKAR